MIYFFRFHFQSIPILYVIMTAKTISAYTSIFEYIRDNLSSEISPSVIMSSYDMNIQSSLSTEFSEATIKGYWCQYTDAVIRYVGSIGMQQEILRNGHCSSWLRMLLVLPLLPAEYLSPGLSSIRKWAEEKNIFTKQMETVSNYVEQQWLRSIGADKMSVFGMPHSIYNHTQQFNKDLQNSVGSDNPSIWNVLGKRLN